MNAYQRTWKERENVLRGAGFQSYDEFLKSDIWQEIKAKASHRKFYQECFLCSSREGIELHHMSYKKLVGKHSLANILPCCRRHHQEIHDLAKELKTSVKSASKKVAKRWVDCGNVEAWLRRKVRKAPKCRKWDHLLKGKSLEPVFKVQ
jgi:hypothetical protein